ncbi:hypothetical protein GCM10017786_74280 [Amycolatopsis deserti]|uniref:histidine kinase n=1 Tax=Amycolatopsis deserti TaxID=185696 RepID=A0ABQ3JHW7_9PSEU|nr:hypothetical protein GCM10017786_74280 [Amycolatopsis deserti]
MAATAEALGRALAADVSLQFGLLVVVFALATTVPPAVLRPVPAAVAVTAGTALSLAFGHCMTAAGAVSQVLVLYAAGAPGVALAVPLVVFALVRPGTAYDGVLAVLLGSFGPAAVWAGIARRARAEANVHRAAREAIADSLVEHTVRGERARIARELHDVVAHHISMIAVQAETARLTTPGMPEAGARRLSEIGDTARAGLTEMRRLLGVLREDVPADRHPQPGLAQLAELLDEARDAAGVGARLIVSGAPAEVDPGVGLAAYRIVQEALTNARRHAPGAAVDVELHYTGEVLRLRIRDNGPGAVREGGHGLSGMRERALAVGGELRAGPATVGGFVVVAELPLEAA